MTINILEQNVFNLDLPGTYPLIIADPPYGQITKEEWDRDWDADSYLQLASRCEDWLSHGGSAYIWGGIGKMGIRHFFEFMSRVEKETGLTLRNVITWSKKRAYGKSNDYLFTREEIAWLVKGEKPARFDIPLLDEKRGYAGYDKKYPALSEYKRRTNVWTDITEVMKGKIHPCEKPEALSRVMILTHTTFGDTILDLFSGSGNASAVAHKLGRHSIAVEADPETADKLRERFIDARE